MKRKRDELGKGDKAGVGIPSSPCQSRLVQLLLQFQHHHVARVHEQMECSSSTRMRIYTSLVNLLQKEKGAMVELLSCKPHDHISSTVASSASMMILVLSAINLSELTDSCTNQTPTEARRIILSNTIKLKSSSPRITQPIAIVEFVERILWERYGHYLNHEWRNISFEEALEKRNRIVLQKNTRDSSRKNVLVLAFIIAYKILKWRLSNSSYTPSGKDIEEELRKQMFFRKVSEDEVVLRSLRLIFFIQILSVTNTTSNSRGAIYNFQEGIDANPNDLDTFKKELALVDSLLTYIQQSKAHFENISGKDSDTLKKRNDGIEIHKENNEFELLWQKMYQEDDCVQTDACDNDSRSQESHEIVQNITSAKNKSETNTANCTRTEDTQDERDASMEIGVDYRDEAIALRPVLIQMSTNAPSSEVDVISNQIVTLFDKAGKIEGSHGIQIIASLLIDGYVSSPSLESACADKCVFPDNLVLSLFNNYITDSLSASRVSSFLTAFVLPSIFALTTKLASRQLVTLFSKLSRDRPMDCVNAFIQILSEVKTNEVTQRELSKSQSELLAKIIKLSSFPDDGLSLLIVASTQIKWSDTSIPFVTSIFLKRPVLQEDLVKTVIKKIEDSASDAILIKSTKFSTCIDTFLKSYQKQFDQECCEALVEVVSKLKTFLAKSMLSKLKKFQC
ncbi:hypothetical protein CTEN210_09261 [Chaetoceros tenuissimus]|uniref:Fanconi Anaemia group E protein C-terminal domain-containing protein n=1 Tax=Chaetoceros tenuissimus TaxID=426638 RepID=A0AAD3CXH4_9STRA|nr:hypothetical protein CTEN210_09261 [Chaetoceros tenuissimus]